MSSTAQLGIVREFWFEGVKWEWWTNTDPEAETDACLAELLDRGWSQDDARRYANALREEMSKAMRGCG